jgi:hypothetical protein
MVRATLQFMAGMVAFLFACELLFRILPVSTSTLTGYHFDPEILSYPPGHSWRVSTGWDLRNPQTLHSNNFGFVSDHDFVRDANAVALIGDSYVESSMLDAADRPGAQLERALGRARPVYAMGSPGTALLDYAERIRFAHERFGIRDFVVLMERADPRQSLCGSGNIHSPCLDGATFAPRNERRPEPSVAKRALRNSALAQYVSGQMKVEPGRIVRQLFPVQKPAAALAPASAGAAIDAVTQVFFERIKPHVLGRLVIVVDCDRAGLQAGRDIADPDRARFIELAGAAGATVIDTEPIFRRHFAGSTLSLDVGPYDGHLNRIGVALVAQAMAATLPAAQR